MCYHEKQNNQTFQRYLIFRRVPIKRTKSGVWNQSVIMYEIRV